jgi:hypothetical protein
MPLPLAFFHSSQKVLRALDSCLEVFDVFGPAVRLRKSHDRPCLPSTPSRLVVPSLVGHFCLRLAGPWVEIHEMVARVVGSQDFMDDGISVLCCNVYERLVALLVANIVQQVKI